MSTLKLGKLPDRTPMKLTISVSPELKHHLEEYAAAYEAAYGQRESVSDLIPYMLRAFLDTDRGFARHRTSQNA